MISTLKSFVSANETISNPNDFDENDALDTRYIRYSFFLFTRVKKEILLK